MTLYASNPAAGAEAEPANTDRSLHAAIINWLDRHPDLLVEYTNGAGWWHTERTCRERPIAWYALIEATGGGGLRIIAAGPRYGRSHAVIGEPHLLTDRLVGWAGGLMFDQMLGEAVADAIETAEQARRQATPTHRRAGRLARVRRALARWSR